MNRRSTGWAWPVRWLRRASLLVVVVLVTLLAARIYIVESGPPLQPWHTYVPQEMRAAELDQADWAGYLAREAALFAAVQREVTERLEPAERVAANRYFAGSPVHPARFAQDWNRSFLLEPEGPVAGAVVLLHGLTDAPFSLRHVAQYYRARGFVAVGLRVPAHGTVPAALTDSVWEDWQAATRLAVREARRRVGPSLPLHIVGYSNGGALAVKHALDAIEDSRLAAPDRLVLISPMIGVTAFARFAGLAGLPALLPAFAKTAWLDILPEFNPFKYNSFPVNAASQTHRLTRALQEQINRLAGDGRLARLPPMLTFQSVLDATVSTRAVLSALYERLPDSASEVVLFDLNRSSRLGPLLRPAAAAVLERILEPAPRRFRATIITNAAADSAAMVELATPAGAVAEERRAIGLDYPPGMYSLSHVALPFPLEDGLYGATPDPADDFGERLGAFAVRGERGALVMGLDSLLRNSSNPFFAYLIGRVGESLPAPR